MTKVLPKTLLTLIGIVFIVSTGFTVASFESDRDDPPPPDSDAQCWDGEDTDNDGNTPPSESTDRGPYDEEPGCVNPYWEDDNEGMILDTHFTATMESLSTGFSVFDEGSEEPEADQTESLFFENEVVVGREHDPEETNEDDTSGGDKTFNYIDAQRSESDDAYGFGMAHSKTVSEGDFSQYSESGTTQQPYLEESTNRFIDTPHEETNVCGNGMQDTGDSCKPDYGDLNTYDSESPTGEGDASANCGCQTSESDEAYYADGDEIIEESQGCESRDDPCSTPCGGEDEPSCRTDYKQDDKEFNEQQDCNTHNDVHGGGLSETTASSNGNDYRMGNSPAATYTEFTAHEANNEAFCGYDHRTTLNADGPNGNGNGFILIDENQGSDSDDIDRVIARESPDQSSEVGRNVHYGVDGSADNELDHDFIDMVDLECGGKTICIQYVDFNIETSGWTIDDNPQNSISDVEDALNVRSSQFQLSESYSVCKAANRINSDYGDSRGSDLVDCDYMREEEGEHRNISPLPEACGDEEDEHLMVMEGSSVNGSVSEQWLGHEQSCVSWGNDETDDNGRELSSSACVNQGEAWAEGTVMNVASENDGVYPYTTDGWEEGGDSPDWQVCLDIDNYAEEDAPKPYNHRHNDPDNDYYGGQWYDLDDQRINQYLQLVEDVPGVAEFDEEISSDIAGHDDQDVDYIDYYYTENPYPYHEDYNPLGDGRPSGNRGTALLADCGSGIQCGDDGDSLRGEVSSEDFGEGVYFGFWDADEDRFDRWTRDDDYHPQGQNDESTVGPRFLGHLVRMKSESNQLESSHKDYSQLDLDNDDWWYHTYSDSDSAVKHAYAESPDWGVDSTGVPYPPAGTSESGDYFTADEAEAGNFGHIDAEEPPRFDFHESSINKTDKAHGNSVLVVAEEDNTHDYEEGQAYWIDPDDIFEEWQKGNIDESYWE